jgi:hypothetical protein
VTSFPFRVTLGLFWATLASWRKTLGLLGPQDLATRATWHTTASKTSNTLGDVMGLPRPTSWCKGHNPPRSRPARLPLVKHPPLSVCNPLICLCPWPGSQHPSGGLLALWRSELIISPYVPIHRVWLCNINKYARHGLISYRDHSNVSHI